MKLGGKIKILLLVVGVVLVVGFFFLQPPKREPVPNPNGYDDFVAAGEMLTGEIPYEKTASVEQCRQYVSANRAALERGRLGLTKLCGVPTEYSSTWIKEHLPPILATRKLANAFCTEGNLARLEKRPGDAAASYLAAIKMGVLLAHGGVMIDGLIATACEAVGVIPLDGVVETLDIEQSRKLLAQLEQVEAEQEPSAHIIDRENLWSAAQLRSISGIKEYVSEVAQTHSLNSSKAAQKDFLAKYAMGLQWELELKAKLAAHVYTLEKGRVPTNWNDLVPAYLKSVPSVPFAPSDTNRLTFNKPRPTVMPGP